MTGDQVAPRESGGTEEIISRDERGWPFRMIDPEWMENSRGECE